MLVVNINLVPFGDYAGEKNIQSLFISNRLVRSAKTDKTMYYVYDKCPVKNEGTKYLFKVWHLRENGATVLVEMVLRKYNKIGEKK